MFRGYLHGALPVPLLSLIMGALFNSALFQFTQLLSESFATFLTLICQLLAHRRVAYVMQSLWVG